MIKVAYEIPDEGACTYYRTVLPISKACKSMVGLPIDRWGDEEQLVARVKAADMYVMARVNHENYLQLIDQIHSKGKKAIVDWDDDIFNVSPLSDHYHKFGTQEFRFGDLDVWVEGKNLDIERNKKRLDTIKKICESVDMVTVTTDRLAEVYRQFNDNIRVLPNCIDIDLWKKLPLKKSDEIRMGWFGGSSHYEDWLEISPILPELFARHKNLKLVIMGQVFKGTIKDLPQDRVETHEWTHLFAYPYKAAILNLDFAIIPLKDSEFNSRKSPIKWIEMGALNVPSVTSYVAPYDSVVDLVPDNGIFVENDHSTWIEGIEKFINDAALREKIGQNARTTVEQNFDINVLNPMWTTAYKEALAWQSPQRQLSAV